jgi:hypothetical protein
LNSKLKVTFVLVLLIGCSSHDELPPPDNPFDPGNPNYLSPNVTMIGGPIDGATLSSAITTFIWQGNESATHFRYLLDGPIWSEWSTETSRTFYLDEGPHLFEIQAKSINGEEQEGSVQVNFEVDAIEGSAFVFKPYGQNTEIGDTITVSVQLLDVEEVIAIGFDIMFPSDSLSFVEYITAEISEAWGGQTLSVLDLREFESVSSLSIALTAVEGAQLGYSGSIQAIYLRFVVEHPGTFWLSPQQILIVKPDGQECQISTSRGARIYAP